MAIMADGWGEYSIAIISVEPWTVIVAVTASVSATPGLLNLVLALICDSDFGLRLQHEEGGSSESCSLGCCKGLSRVLLRDIRHRRPRHAYAAGTHRRL